MNQEDIDDLDLPLLELKSPSGTDHWTVRNACSGVQIFGATGSGKTSASGKLLAINYLRGGFGGLVLTVKPDEVDLWREYCALTGRSDDLVIIEPKGEHSFNIIDHVIEHSLDNLAVTDNIVEVLNEVIQASQEQDAGQNESFWRDQLQLLLTNTIDLCRLAYNDVSVRALYQIVQTIPKSDEALQTQDRPRKAFYKAFAAAQTKISDQVTAWKMTLSLEEQEQLQDADDFEQAFLEAVPDAQLFRYVESYFADDFIQLGDKTRSVIQVSFSAFLFRLLREPFYSLFCRYPSTVTPEDCFEGKIVVINLPVKKYHKAGRDTQMVCKYLFQRAWEGRDVKVHRRPCFLFIDESHTFLSESDASFLTTARSSRIATVFLSQSLSNYLWAMGGKQAEPRVHSLMGNFGTKIFHSNTDTTTNDFVSKMIGDAYFEDATESVTVAKDFSQTRGRSLKLERVVRPEQFTNLRTGGPKNNYTVEGYIHRQGDSFRNGQNHMRMAFDQNYLP